LRLEDILGTFYEVKEEVSLVKEKVVFDRLQTLDKLALVEYHVHQLLGAPLIGSFYRFIEIKLGIQVSACSRHIFSLLLHLLISVGLGDGKARAGEEHVFVLGPWVFEVLAALPYHVEVFARVQHLFLMLCEENGNHFIPIGESFLPVLIIEVLLNILLALGFVLPNDKFVEGVLEDSLENPFP
jgi:hypothetical protein